MSLPKNPPKVDQSVAGAVKIKTNEVQKKLGKPAWTVWVALIWRRDRYGYSRATIATIQNETQLSYDQVKRAFRRLKTVCLVTPKAKPTGPRLWARRVYGDYRNGQVVVTALAFTAILAAGTRGGDHRSKEAATMKKRREAASRALKSSAENRPKRPTKPHQSADQTALPKIGYKREDNSLFKTMAANAAPAFGKSKSTSLESLLRPTIPREPRHYSVPRGGTAILPPLNNSRITRHVARTPPPPCLDADADDRQRVTSLAYAYRGAHALRHGPCWSLNGDLKKSRHWKTMLAAAEAAIEYAIPLGSWSLWSFDVWAAGDEGNTKKGKAPPVGFVWSAKRIEERRGWFKNAHGYHGGRVWPTESGADYVRQWRAMATHLYQLPREVAMTDLAQQEALALYFPNGIEEYIDRACEEAREQQGVITRAIARSDWSVL